MEVPEEDVDDRSLYHRLQEQKEKKEAEKAEEHKMRNMVHGLKKDETDFLDFVASKQMEVGIVTAIHDPYPLSVYFRRDSLHYLKIRRITTHIFFISMHFFG